MLAIIGMIVTVYYFHHTTSHPKTTRKTAWFRVLLFSLLIGLQVVPVFGAASWDYTKNTGSFGTTYDWIDCSSGSNIVSGDNEAANLAWPFNFECYDDVYTTANNLSVCTNGFIRLDGSANTNGSTASGFPSWNWPRRNYGELGQIVALGVYNNMIGDNGGWVRSLVTGTAPNRILTIEYNNLEIDYNDNGYASVQVSFYETSNKIVLKFKSENINRSSVEMGLYSGNNDYYSYWQEINGATANTWMEFSKPVVVTSTSGTAKAKYDNLGAAFTAVNNGTHQGVINITLVGNTTETTTASLNQSGSGSANYTSLTVKPIVSGVTVSGSVDGGLVNLNGADNVVVDGRLNAAGIQPDLTFINTSTGSSTYTMGFTNSAQGNTVKFVNIKGGGGSASNGTVFFGTGTNTNNTLAYCRVTNNGTRRINAIYSQGGTTTGTQLTGNAVYDTWSTTASSYGVNASTGTSGWNLVKNSFYETSNFQPSTAATTYSAIYLNNTSGTYTLTNNYIGGKDSLCGGLALRMGVDGTATSTIFQPVYLNVGTNASSVQGNTIKNITYRSTNATPFYGYCINNGRVDLGTVEGNALGDSTGTGSILLAGTSATTLSYGIYVNGTSTVNVSNNRIGSVTTSNTSSTNAHSFHAISKAASTGTVVISENKVGSEGTVSNILTSSTSTANPQVLYGIFTEGSTTSEISDNIVANITNGTTEATSSSKMYGIYALNGTNTILRNTVHDLTTGGAANGANYTNVSMTGIHVNSLNGSQSITNNTVYNLISTTPQKVEFYGIMLNGTLAGNDLISGNFVYGFKMLSENTNCYLHGISAINGTATGGVLTISNNVVFLGDEVTTGCSIFGILKYTNKQTNIYHNTVHLGGTVVDGSGIYSYSLRDRTDGTPYTREVKNNIFYNTRSGGGSNNSIYFQTTGNLTIDYNDYGWSGTYFAEVGSTGIKYVTLQEWSTFLSGQDSHSLTVDPLFDNMGGNEATDYKTGIGLDGVSGTGVTIDFGGNVRSSGFPTIGAWESFPIDVYNASTYRASYSTLKGAFDAINAGTWTGNLTIKVKGSTQETATARLNAPVSPASYTNVTIYPTRENVQIRGDLTSDVVWLNGAQQVVFDGRLNGTGTTPNMTLVNVNTGTGANTLRFSESASNNVIQYCYLRGAGSGASSAVVNFSTATSGSGNDGNAIAHSVISGVDATNRPYQGIYSFGTTGRENSNNSLLNNKMMDSWRATSASFNIRLESGSADWVIQDNSIFETAAVVPTGAFNYTALHINTPGFNHTISGNYIGGTLEHGLGSAMQLGSTAQGNTFVPIYLNVGAAGAGTSVQGNTITNFVFNSRAAQPFSGIAVAGGKVKMGTIIPNVLGASSGTGSIQLNQAAVNAQSYGFNLTGSDSIVVSGNQIGSITTSNAATLAHNFTAVQVTGAPIVTLSSNTIGSTTTASSIQTASASTANQQTLMAINYTGSNKLLAEMNTIVNLLNSSTATSGISGITASGTGSTRIQQNFISNLALASTNTASNLWGINLTNGSSVCVNNVLNLGALSLGYYTLYGIQETGVSGYSDSISHNTVYLSGLVSGTGGAAFSYAFHKTNNLGGTVLLNNVLFNARSAGNTSSRHYAVRLPGMSSISSIDGNDYYATGTYNRLGRINTTDYTALATWTAATLGDAGSVSVNPNLANVGGSSALDYKPKGILKGVPALLMHDFGGFDRDLLEPTIGAWEFSYCIEVHSNGIYRQSYTTLKEAFDAINAGTWTGDLQVRVLKSTYETATARLLASGSGPTYSRVFMYPTRSNLSIDGSINAALIQLDGADDVTIDGRVNATGTTPNLLLSNINSGATASTVQWINSAQRDTLQYCFIKGAGTGTTSGTLHFSTATVAPGNSGNVVRNCIVSGYNATERPVNAVYSAGTTGRVNTGNQLLDNRIESNAGSTGTRSGIHIGANSTAFTISGNRFYQATTLNATAANEYAAIRINNASGNGFTVSNNIIGSSTSDYQGDWVKIGTAGTFYGIYLNVGTSTVTSVQGNTIGRLSITNVGNADVFGIQVAGGSVNVGTQTGNTIGASTGNGSITLTNSATNGAVYGISITGTGSVEAANNTIASITAANSSAANATHIYGISKGNVAGSLIVRDNQIGSTSAAHSLQATSDAYSASQFVYGIYSLGTGTNSITANTIANVSNKTIETTQSSKLAGIYAGAGVNTIHNNSLTDLYSGGVASGALGVNAPLHGLLLVSTSANQVLSNNTITRLRTGATAKIYVYGLYYSGPTTGTNQLYKNFINRIFLPTAPPESEVYGVFMAGGTFSANNNIIAIGDSITKGLSIRGFANSNANASAMTMYHNTIYIGGTVTAGTSNSFAYRDEASGSVNLRNNLIANMRSGGGKHYAILLDANTGLTINFNNYFAGGTNGVLGYLGADRATLAAWKTATAQDAASLSINPLFIIPGSTQAVDYTPTATLTVANVLISDDYTGATRLNPPTVGALEFTGYFWMGTIDTDWSKTGNWSPNIVPTIGVSANIPNRINKPTIINGVAAQVNNLNIYSGAIVTINPGGTLTVASTITNNAGAAGLVIHSTEDGTGSLIASQNGVQATVRRFIRRQSARNTAWFTLSSPITAQTIRGTEWTPSGSFGDGTGYDLFLWDEATAAWVYNLNDTTTLDKKWSVAHPQSYFVPGRGYLYSLYDSISTKSFVGTLNNGTIQTPLTVTGSGLNTGFQLVGNPYPSSMDWKAASGFGRSNLTLTGGGYDIWMWSSTSNNYGLYNSALTGDVGTLNASRYIAPMQGFFVLAATAGNLAFNNNARVHNSAGAWLRSASTWMRSAATEDGGTLRLKVVSASGSGSDEVMLRFGATSDDKGSAKLFSPVETAPSLYLPIQNKDYSIRTLTTVSNNASTAVSFKPGVSDTYTLTCEFDASLAESVLLEDKRTGKVHNFAESGVYIYSAAPGDASDRFILHYGSIPLNPGIAKYRVYVTGSDLMVNLEEVSGEYTVSVFDVNGRIQQNRALFGGSIHALPLRNRGVYIVSIQTVSGVYNQKVVY